MRVIIAGGGVAGIASALALRQIGAEVTVYEAHQDPAGSAGSFISLASNGLRGLAALGCLNDIQKSGFDVARLHMWSSSGKLIGDFPRGRLSNDPLHSVTLMRGALVATLRKAAAHAGVKIITGEKLVEISSSSNEVTIGLASGKRETGDLLIGADGISSSTRNILDPGAPKPQYAGLYTVSGTSLGPEIEPGIFNMTFCRNGSFLAVRTMPEGHVWWSAQIADAIVPSREPNDEITRLNTVAELFKDEKGPASIIAATIQSHGTTIMQALDPVPIWHNERVVLVGDAAHPVGAGQGASAAIEDAIVLARSLRTANSVPAALIAYEAERRPRVNKLLKLAEDNRRVKKSGSIKKAVQVVMMPVFLRLFYEKATAWLYSYDPLHAPKP